MKDTESRRSSGPLFGFKFQAAVLMAGVIFAIVAATLTLVENTLRTSYRSVFSEQFNNQIQRIVADIHASKQLTQDLLENLSTDPRILASFEGASRGDSERLFYDTINALRSSPLIQALDRPAFLAILDNKGASKFPRTSESPHIVTADHALAPELRKGLNQLQGQQVEEPSSGLWLPGEGANHVYEVTLMPVVDFFETRVGTLVIGLPFEIGRYTSGEAVISLAMLNDGVSPADIEIVASQWNLFAQHFPQSPPFGDGLLRANFSLDTFQALMASIRSNLVVFGSIAIVIGLLLSLRVGASLARPVEGLVDFTQAIQAGRLTTRIDRHRRDEFGQLTQAFNAMAEGLELKERYHSVLNKVTDPAVADLLMQGAIDMQGETRSASVLFCDIRGFTPLTQGMDPHKVIALVNEHMSALTEVVIAHGGIVDKFIGDEIMALFGVPKSYGNDADDAVHCARAMIAARRQLNQVTAHPRIEIGVGIATGRLVAGCMGSVNRLNYTVLGDTVNLAARLCGRAPAGECRMDEATAHALTDNSGIVATETVPVKGFPHPIPTYRLQPNTPEAS